jgi:hypothetical protein
MMQVAAHQVIDVIPVRHRLVAAARTMNVIGGVAGTRVLRRAAIRVCRGDRKHVFVDMIAMHMVQMAVMQIVDVTVVADRNMAALRSVPMVVVIVLQAIRHDRSPYP